MNNLVGGFSRDINSERICDWQVTCNLLKEFQRLIEVPNKITWSVTEHSNCVLNDTPSSKGLITIGVPQGSILGLLLFFNDLPNVISSCDINMYVDDTELLYSNDELKRASTSG